MAEKTQYVPVQVELYKDKAAKLCKEPSYLFSPNLVHKKKVESSPKMSLEKMGQIGKDLEDPLVSEDGSWQEKPQKEVI
eukprot:CAMPEP_0170562578 /NCGR_PEP_ID=MMETSP0211-20121228/61332_1 /TAXON_ID=311385 /ORGANISM="Pseudokeronopsis sp., Strain OXSARD2" /LENGTH=78 /DNA_ID=CAMNT_0010879645 /DNA_START=301 /DNA_END=537 /DNA_ORIENTATION=+